MRSRFNLRYVTTLVAFGFALSGSAFAQQNNADVAALSQQAHKLAKEAKTLEQFTAALRVCGQAMKSSPSDVQKQYIHKLAAWTYNKRGEKLVKLSEEKAPTDPKLAASYEKAAIDDFGLAARFDKTDWKPRFNRAVSVAMLGDFETAMSDLDFVLQKQPSHINALFNRAEILLQQGEYEKAIADYAQVLKKSPNDGAAHAGRGIAYSALGEMDKALNDLNSVVRLEPENATAYVDRGDLYAAIGQWERAAGDYRIAISLDDALGRAYQNVAWMMATCPETRFRNPELSVRAAEKAIELDGETYLGLDTLAAALASTGQFQKAVQTQQKAIQSAPATERQDLSQRLALYQQQQPFIEKQADAKVQLATALEEIGRQ